MSKDADREARLAAALRANLRRRKDQQRGSGDAPAAPDRDDDRDRGDHA